MSLPGANGRAGTEVLTPKCPPCFQRSGWRGVLRHFLTSQPTDTWILKLIIIFFFSFCLSYQSPGGTLRGPQHPHLPAMAGSSLGAHPTGNQLPGCGPELQAGCRQAAGRLHSLQSPPRARRSLCSVFPPRRSPCTGCARVPPAPWSELGRAFSRQQKQAAAGSSSARDAPDIAHHQPAGTKRNLRRVPPPLEDAQRGHPTG